MPSYVKNSLLKDERILFSTQLSVWPYSLHIAAGALCLLAAISIGWLWSAEEWLRGCLTALAFIPWAYVYFVLDTTEVVVTNARVIIKRGFIRRGTSELFLTRIEGVEVEQSLTGRMLGYGTLFIRGVGTEVAPLDNIVDPIKFRNEFFNAADKLMATETEPQRNKKGFM